MEPVEPGHEVDVPYLQTRVVWQQHCQSEHSVRMKDGYLVGTKCSHVIFRMSRSPVAVCVELDPADPAGGGDELGQLGDQLLGRGPGHMLDVGASARAGQG